MSKELFSENIINMSSVSTFSQKKDNKSKINSRNSLKISIISDIHLFPKDYAGKEGPNFIEYITGDRKMLIESERIFDKAIEKIIDENPDVLLIPGDLTKDSEKLAHEIVAKKLMKVKKNGIEVFVINGNHDINNPYAIKFQEDLENPGMDIMVPVESIKGCDFERIYEEFGFKQAIARHDTSLSYVAKIKPGFRLIAIDSCRYGDDPKEQDTSGEFRIGLVQWLLKQIEEAKEDGDEIIGMMHHGIVEHFEGQAIIFPPYLVKGWEVVSSLLADAGLKYIFTGHFHGQNITSKTTNNGNTIYDIMTGSLVTSPSPIRNVEINFKSDIFKSNTVVIDSIEEIEDFKRYSFDFLVKGIPDMVVSLLQQSLLSLVKNNKYNLYKIIKIIGVENVDIEKIIYEISRANSDQIDNFIIGVTNELKEEMIINDVKIMEVIGYCLIKLYNGNKRVDPKMDIILNEVKKEEVIVDLLTRIILDNKRKLGVRAVIINESFIRAIFNEETLEGVTIGKKLSLLLSKLINGILDDSKIDGNNVIIYKGEVLKEDNNEILLEISNDINSEIKQIV